jgi:hypothetical protein
MTSLTALLDQVTVPAELALPQADGSVRCKMAFFHFGAGLVWAAQRMVGLFLQPWHSRICVAFQPFISCGPTDPKLPTQGAEVYAFLLGMFYKLPSFRHSCCLFPGQVHSPSLNFHALFYKRCKPCLRISVSYLSSQYNFQGRVGVGAV